MSSLLQHIPKFNRHPAFVKIDDFMARLDDYAANGDESLVNYCLENARVEGDTVLIIHRSNFQHDETQLNTRKEQP